MFFAKNFAQRKARKHLALRTLRYVRGGENPASLRTQFAPQSPGGRQAAVRGVMSAFPQRRQPVERPHGRT